MASNRIVAAAAHLAAGWSEINDLHATSQALYQI